MKQALSSKKSVTTIWAMVFVLLVGSADQVRGNETTVTENQVQEKQAKPWKNSGQAQEYTPVQPEKIETNTSSTPMIVLGGALAVGVAALALGGGGGSDSADEDTTAGTDVTTSNQNSSCIVSDVGPSIAGSDWSGNLRLINYGSQGVTARITQCGRKITITTSTGLHHGRSFSGSISSGGDIHVADNTTNQIWTTFKGSASSRSIRIYDYVNDQTALDSLELSR